MSSRGEDLNPELGTIKTQISQLKIQQEMLEQQLIQM